MLSNVVVKKNNHAVLFVDSLRCKVDAIRCSSHNALYVHYVHSLWLMLSRYKTIAFADYKTVKRKCKKHNPSANWNKNKQLKCLWYKIAGGEINIYFMNMQVILQGALGTQHAVLQNLYYFNVCFLLYIRKQIV